MPRAKKENIVGDFEAEVINEEVIELKNNEVKYKEEICPVLWVKDHAFAINFQGYGLSFHVKDNHYIDFEKIKNFVKVNYENEIGNPDFKIHVVYE